MLTPNTLRIDCGPGSPILDYRIENGSVQSREVDMAGKASDWRFVSPEELSSHILSNTVVAEWLRRRMGLHGLLQACRKPCIENSAQCEEQLAA